jgi:hypothetical protein
MEIAPKNIIVIQSPQNRVLNRMKWCLVLHPKNNGVKIIAPMV